MADKKNAPEKETEEQLVERARVAVSRCNWEVGECAAQWTKRYARGRTDADFATMVGLSADQVYQRRRVVETFGNQYKTLPELKWSHFYLALNWDDAAECLNWANENQATVAEMRAWRRAIRGEDLTSEPPADDFAGDSSILHLDDTRAVVKDIGEERPKANGSGRSGGIAERAQTVNGVAKESNENDYAPYRSGAGSPAPKDAQESPSRVGTATKLSALRVVKRATSALQRVNEALTDDVLDDFGNLPRDVRERFTSAVAELSSRVAALL